MSTPSSPFAFLATVVILALSVACDRSQTPSADQTTSAAPATNTPGGVATAATVQTVLIPVEGMSCVACAARVRKTLADTAGVEEVEVHLGERNARVRFDSSRVTADRLVGLIKELGYSAGTPAAVNR